MSTLSKNNKSEITGKGFEFVGKGHSYYLDGKRMTGVTTILGVIAKPQLISWASRMATEFIAQAIKDGKEITPELLEEAKNAHRTIKESAGEKGTDVHFLIEEIIKTAMKGDGHINGDYLGDSEQVKHFWNWTVENKVRFLESEKKIYSKELFVAGTIDFMCEINGEIWVGDIKTSSAIYPEHFFQTAGYQRIMQDMDEKYEIKGHIILNCRKDGSFEEKRSISNEDNMSAFLAALTLYRLQEKVKSQIIG